MRDWLFTGVAGIVLALVLFTTAIAADDRQGITLDPATKAEVLAEMRGLTERLDDVLVALAEGKFKDVARIAEIHLGFGHKKLEAMLAAGATDEQIAARRARMKANRKAREEAGTLAQTRGMGLFGIQQGLGAKLPEDFWWMGQSMHGAAEDMAVAARTAAGKAEQPSIEDYQAVLAKLQEMTATCRGCHNAFRLD